MRTRIILHRGPECWEATYEGVEADDIMRLFGTTTLPTPFPPDLPAVRVLSEIRRLNPNAEVALAGHPD